MGRIVEVPKPVIKTQQTASVKPTQTSFAGEAKMFIYFHESGNNPKAVNSIGCIGLGQDCNGQLRIICPALDYACEDTFFTNYMKRRYGTWENAKLFWLNHKWW